jgi:hypothetical protein
LNLNPIIDLRLFFLQSTELQIYHHFKILDTIKADHVVERFIDYIVLGR